MGYSKMKSLSELFYYDPSSKKRAALRKGLEEFRFLLLVSIEAVKSLQNGDLEKFDALVGENACQIRAIKVAIIASGDLSYLDDLSERLTKSLEATNQLLANTSIQSLMQSGSSLEEVIDRYKLDVQICGDAMFCIQAYVLTEMKECLSDTTFSRSLCKEETSVPKKLCFLAPNVSIAFVHRFSNKLKKLLSESSVSFVGEAAISLEDPILMQVLSDNARYHNTKACIPMFWTYKTLLLWAQKAKIPFLFHAKFLNESDNSFHVIDEEFLYFKTCPISNEYVRVIPTEEDLANPACTIEGAVCLEDHCFVSKDYWINSFSSHSVFDIVLAGAADHRQYPNPGDVPNIQDEEFEKYKKMAQEKGFSLDDPRTFFIQHVYSSQLGRKFPSFKSDALHPAI